ncbi:MAG: hypothetical protein K9L78_02215 [Victivallales bacterium]|nr:hypothetical protein [Victivallales bacterium]MCF7888909.1 hypothetical protein [Victivallales bacterium]
MCIDKTIIIAKKAMLISCMKPTIKLTIKNNCGVLSVMPVLTTVIMRKITGSITNIPDKKRIL